MQCSNIDFNPHTKAILISYSDRYIYTYLVWAITKYYRDYYQQNKNVIGLFIILVRSGMNGLCAIPTGHINRLKVKRK